MSRQASQPADDFDQVEKELMDLRPLPIDRSISEQLSLQLDQQPPVSAFWRKVVMVATAACFVVVVLFAVQKLKSPVRVPGPAPMPSQNEMAEQIDPDGRPFTLAAYQAAAAQGPRALESLLKEQATQSGAISPPVRAPAALNQHQAKIMTAGGATVN